MAEPNGSPRMEVQPLDEGLWRWTAPHPDWTPEKGRPGGWGRMVGCIYYEPPDPADITVLIDPLAPPDSSPDHQRFWDAMDADLKRRRLPLLILLGNTFHRRSAGVVRERYRESHAAVIHAHADARGRVDLELDGTFAAAAELPGGVRAMPIEGLEAAETVFYLPPVRTLVIADALIGSAGPGGVPRVRVAPESWGVETPEGALRYRELFRPSLRRLLDLDIERLVVSHGPPVLSGGREALEDALESPAWGA